jgi:Tfp pilus assembly protein PilX
MYRPVRRLKARKGFAMFMALGALVIIGVLVAGSSYVTLQETRLGQNSIVQTRAFSAAEYGLNKIQADWDKTPNLVMANGASFDTSYTLDGQGTCQVRYTRLNNETFWIVSEGRAAAGNALSATRTAVKRVGAILRLRIPTIRANGAITTAGNINVQGSPQVNGLNNIPPGWTGCDATAPNKAGIVATPTATVSIQKPTQVIGVPQVVRDALAADDNTYIRYGDETWNTLVTQANITITNGTGPNLAQPTLRADGSCRKEDPANWGEPSRVAGYVEACINYFPIIYSTTSLHLNSGRGQGILLVEGDVRINGNFEWFGLIVARDDITKGNGTATIRGAVMARNAELTDASAVTGNININYSQCALERAMRGSASVLQAKERAWAELY